MHFLFCLEFEDWKDEFEKREKCRFVKKSGSRMTDDGLRVCYFYCSRSGNFVSHSRGIKKRNAKGTSKSSVHCTASITLIEATSGMVQVKACATHYGHTVDLKHLRLTKFDKSNIAGQIAQGVPRDIVLDNIRASAGSDVDRIHMVTIKDIKNIEKAFGIQSNEHKRVNYGITNLDSWVSKMKSFGDDSMIVYYKNKEVLASSEEVLDVLDVCLILMTRGQSDIFKKFGENGIFYLPVILIKNDCEMHLYSLMVVDDINEVVPVAFMISNRLDEVVVNFFCQKIRNKIGPLTSKALMTDNFEILHKAWCSVFGETTKHFWSTRYVDSDWRELLIMVKDEDVQCSIYETLYSFFDSKDPVKFEKQLEEFMADLTSNAPTQQFGKFFNAKYLNTKELWAGCYGKKDVGINVHLNLDTIYNEIKGVCNSRGKYGRLFDKTVQDLLKVVSDRQCHRNTKICRQAQDLALHHSMAVNIKEECIIEQGEDKWRVNSVKDPEKIYSTVERRGKPCSHLCPLYCSKCSICTHAFKCSCSVHQFDCTMCKHIHAVGLLLAKKRQEEEDTSIEENTTDCSMEFLVKQVLMETSSLQTDVVTLIESMKKQVDDLSEDEILDNVLIRLKKGQTSTVNTPPPKRKRGRPRKTENVVFNKNINESLKKTRGRKKKRVEPVEQTEITVEVQENLRRSERPRKRNPFIPNILRR